jgi:hypothetical protein
MIRGVTKLTNYADHLELGHLVLPRSVQSNENPSSATSGRGHNMFYFIIKKVCNLFLKVCCFYLNDRRWVIKDQVASALHIPKLFFKVPSNGMFQWSMPFQLSNQIHARFPIVNYYWANSTLLPDAWDHCNDKMIQQFHEKGKFDWSIPYYILTICHVLLGASPTWLRVLPSRQPLQSLSWPPHLHQCFWHLVIVIVVVVVVMVVYERRKKGHIRTVVALTSRKLYNSETNKTPTFDFPEDSLDCAGTSFAGARQEQNQERHC